MSNLHARGRAFLERESWAAIVTETVTLSIRGVNDKSFTTIEGVTAFRRVLDNETAAVFGGHLEQQEIVFHLRVSTITAGVVVSPGCKITDAAGVVYIIPPDTPGAVQLQQWADRWKCVFVKAVS